jgi:hypothetical protein
MGARFVIAAVAVIASCAQILGLDEYQDTGPGSSTGTGGMSSSSGSAGGMPSGGGTPSNVVWAKSWGGPAQQRLSDFAVDGNDAIVMTGNHDGPFAFGALQLAHAGMSDFFVAKVDAAGGEMWSSAWGDDKEQYALAIARKLVSEELTYVTGRFTGTLPFPNVPLTTSGDNLDGFVVRFSAQGAPNSAYPFLGTGVEHPAPIAAAPLTGQNLLITGHTMENMGIAGGTVTTTNQRRGFLARIYGGGAADWLVQFGTAGTQTPFDIAGDGLGNSVVVGSFTGSIEIGGVYAALGGNDAFVAQFATGTGYTWLRVFGSSGDEHVERVALTDDGEVLVVGTFSGMLPVGTQVLTATGGDADLWLARLASDGNVMWVRPIEAGGIATPRALTIDRSTGRLWLAADFDGQITTETGVLESVVGTDIFVAAIDSESGEVLDARRYGEPVGASEGGIQSLAGLAVRSDGSLVLAGSFEGDIDFNGTILTSAGGNDVFMVVLGP